MAPLPTRIKNPGPGSHVEKVPPRRKRESDYVSHRSANASGGTPRASRAARLRVLDEGIMSAEGEIGSPAPHPTATDAEERDEEKWGTPSATTPIFKKAGRKSNAERLGRQRSNSASTLNEMWMLKEKRRREDDQIALDFPAKRSDLTKRSPVAKTSATKTPEKIYTTTTVDKTPEQPQHRGKIDVDNDEEEKEEVNMQQILKLLYNLVDQVKDLRKEGEEGRRELKTEIDNLKTTIETIKKESHANITKLEKEIKNMEENGKERDKQKDLEWGRKFDELKRSLQQKPVVPSAPLIKEIVNIELGTRKESDDREERRNNVIITGLQIMNEVEKAAEINNFLSILTENEIKIKEIHTIGNERKKHIKVILNTWEDKKKIMEKRKNLKGREIYINNDLTKKESSIQKQLRDVVRKERAAGKIANAGYKRIWVENKEFIWSEEEEKLKEAVF